MSQWPVHIKLTLLLTKIIKDVSSYSKGVQKKSVKDGIENGELTIFSVWRKNEKRWPSSLVQGVPKVRSSKFMHYNFWSKLYFYMKYLEDVYFSIKYMYSEFQ